MTQRSTLIILVAACKAAKNVFAAAADAAEAELCADLTTLIARSEAELERISRRIEAGGRA